MLESVINLYHTSNTTVIDAFDGAVANLCRQREKHGYKSFLLAGCEPGAGTTTVSLELSIALARTGWKTLLIDADMRKNVAYKRLNENINRGLVDYIVGTCEEDEIIYPTNVEFLSYISSGNTRDRNPLRLFYSHRTSKLLSILENMYDFIIVDSPALNSCIDSHILAGKCNSTILVAALDGSSKKVLEDDYEKLTKEGVSISGVIENKISLDSYKNYLKDYDYFQEKKYLHGNHLSFDKF